MKITKHLGNEGEAAVMLELTKLNLPVFKELGDSSPVDLITVINGIPITIQVKSTSSQNKQSAVLQVRKTGKHTRTYNSTEFNLFALYISDLGRVLWINSSEALQRKTTINFRFKESLNGQKKGIRNAGDYVDFYKAIGYA